MLYIDVAPCHNSSLFEMRIEDINCIFPDVQVVPDPEKPLSGFKFKCLYDKEQKGPVTEVECIMGHIVSAIGMFQQ